MGADVKSERQGSQRPLPFIFNGRTGKETAPAELAKRGDLKSRRPPGLADLDSPEAIQKAVDAAIDDLGCSDPDVVSSARGRIEYLGPAAFDSLADHLASDDNEQRRWASPAYGAVLYVPYRATSKGRRTPAK
jgi:hypothetical protein